ncbi:hypothetical protein NQZ79_g7141 [Umbelopsis isabellina]|nr:hypothetical protein NQZ79_g7141 [Umbelopsis isabellina]
MQNKTLLILISVYLISCFAIAVSAFSFSSSDKKDVGAQGIVKRGGDHDDDDHKHDDDDHGKKDHGHDEDDHDDDDCRDAISKASASFLIGGSTYKIPCGTGAVNINNICYEALGGGSGVGGGPGAGLNSAVLVFGSGTGAVTSSFACGTATLTVPLQPICGPAATVTETVLAGSNGVCSPLSTPVTVGSGTNTAVVTVTCGGTAANPVFPCPPVNPAAEVPAIRTPAAEVPAAGSPPAAGTNVLVTIGTGTGATVSTVSCPTTGPQAVTIGTGTAASVTTVTC